MTEAPGIRIAGVGAYAPEKRLTNHELAQRIDTSHEWIAQKTGILEQQISGPGEAPSDMGCQAARRCLRDAGVDASRPWTSSSLRVRRPISRNQRLPA